LAFLEHITRLTTLAARAAPESQNSPLHPARFASISEQLNTPINAVDSIERRAIDDWD
jgi:hypothetical protein